MPKQTDECRPCALPASGTASPTLETPLIFHVITDFSSPEGAQTMLIRLLGEWRGARHRIVALGGVSDRMRALLPETVEHASLRAASLARMPKAFIHLAALIRRDRPAAVVCWMYHSMVAGQIAAAVSLRRLPVYWTVRQSLDDPGALTRSTRVALRLAALLSRFSAGIIYNADRARTLHRAEGYAEANDIVIPNGVRLPELPPARTGEPRVFGIAGRLHPQKDHATFFRAAAIATAREPKIRFVCAGKGMERASPAVSRMIAEAGAENVAIEFLGEVRDMASFYSRIDGLVLSSRTEGFPNVVAEAMSYARPVVATDVGDCAAVVGDAGTIVPSGDPAALATAIVEMAQVDRQRFLALGAKARRRIEDDFAIAPVARAYEDFITRGFRGAGQAERIDLTKERPAGAVSDA